MYNGGENMAQCEMCGKDTSLVNAIIEGTTLSVCTNCAKYGNILQPVKSYAKPKGYGSHFTEQETEAIVEDYGARVKNARERKDMKQEDLAKAIAEKESVVHKIESGRMEPSFTIAKKLEHFLGIRLITKVKLSADALETEKSSGGMTIGDMIKFKKE
ncbi:MAG: multiprotein bridging factor aMBF1 [Candidatus Woesearchaeota archaeon]